MSRLAPFADFASFEALDPAARLAPRGAARRVRWGKAFRSVGWLVGSKQMVAVEHVPTGASFVVVPGGSFDMGLRDDDAEEVTECLGSTAAVERMLMSIEAMATPVHRVTVPPFLLAISHLTSAQVATMTAGAIRIDALAPADATWFERHASGFRLPSEAELEYVGREGGELHFLGDGEVESMRGRAGGRRPRRTAGG